MSSSRQALGFSLWALGSGLWALGSSNQALALDSRISAVALALRGEEALSETGKGTSFTRATKLLQITSAL
jgi:hypothetical protein